MRVRRPKTKTKRCAHCERRRLAKFIEWHPGIDAWQCSDFSNCDAAIAAKEAKQREKRPPVRYRCAACDHVGLAMRVHFKEANCYGDVCSACSSEDIFDVDDHEGWTEGERALKERQRRERERREREGWV